MFRISKPIRLGLNCIGTEDQSIFRSVVIESVLTGGKETTLMVRLLGNDAHLVSYGAMAKQPLSIPTSYFIFKNLTCHGFWQSQWYKTKTREEREALVQDLVHLIKEKKVGEFRCSRASTQSALLSSLILPNMK